MATLANVLTYARAQAQTDSNGLTDANGIIFANEALLDFHREMIYRGVDASQIQESTDDGVANQGTYLWPTDMFLLKTLECNYTDTTNSNYRVADQVDVSNIPAGRSFSWLRANQSAQFPKFDDRGDWFEIFPTPTGSHNLTNLFSIFYYLEPTEYSTTADTITYPVSLDYRILGWRIAAIFKKSLGDFDSAVAFDNEYMKKVEQLVKTLSRGSQQPIQAVPIQDDGWNF